MDARCDECGKAFVVMAQTRRDGDTETTFFACVHCGHEYIVCRTDPGIRTLQRQTERQRRLNGERQRNGVLNNRHHGQLRRKVSCLKAKMDALNRAE